MGGVGAGLRHRGLTHTSSHTNTHETLTSRTFPVPYAQENLERSEGPDSHLHLSDPEGAPRGDDNQAGTSSSGGPGGASGGQPQVAGGALRSTAPVLNPVLGQYFDRMDGTRYLPNAFRRYQFPDG